MPARPCGRVPCRAQPPRQARRACFDRDPPSSSPRWRRAPISPGFSSGFKWAPFGTLDQTGLRILAKSYSGIASTPGLTLYKREPPATAMPRSASRAGRPSAMSASTWRRQLAADRLHLGKAFRDQDEYGIPHPGGGDHQPFARWTLTTKAALSSASREAWGQHNWLIPCPARSGPGPTGCPSTSGRLMVGIETEHSVRERLRQASLWRGQHRHRHGPPRSRAVGRLPDRGWPPPLAYGRLTLLWRQ